MLSSAMAYNLKGTPVSHCLLDGSLKSTLEEHKGLLLNFDTEDQENGELPCYEDEEYTKPQERILFQKRRIVWIAGGFIGLILSVAFLAPMLTMWCGRMGAARRPMDPSKFLSNGTHKFKQTVLIMSLNGFQ